LFFRPGSEPARAAAGRVEIAGVPSYDVAATNPIPLSKGTSMARLIRPFSLAALLVALTSTTQAADTFTVDPVHSSVSFMISHAGISFIHGRFNDFSGKFVIDKKDPAKSSFNLTVNVASVDTNNQKRDEHLRASDYFDAQQYPTMSFHSTLVTPVDGGYEVVGKLTLRGISKVVTLNLKGGEKTVEFPKGTERVGFVTTPIIKRSDFDMKAGLPAVGDEVFIKIGVEAVKD
jgi:polyisoprenoid-binding protein YceI